MTRRVLCGSILCVVIAWSAALNVASAADRAAVPADYGFSTPNPTPQLPVEMDRFTPPLLGEGAEPSIGNFTHTAGPDEIAVLAGPEFSPSTSFRFFGQSTDRDAVTLDRAAHVTDDVAASVIAPAQLPAWSTYLVWPKAGKAFGRPVALNRTDAWWIGPDRATPTDTVSIYGRNLAHGNTGPSWVYLKPKGPLAGQWIKPIAVNPYCVTFDMPRGAPGEYEVWTHNGHGGTFGWSGPLSLVVIEQSPFDAHDKRTINVKDFGATGDGSTDDTPALKRALLAAEKAAPCTLTFPAGTYVVNDSLQPPADVSWLGEGRDRSILKAGATFKKAPAPAMIFSDSDEVHTVRFSKLTFDGDGQVGQDRRLFQLRHHRNVGLTDCRFVFKGAEGGFSLEDNDYLTISGNEFIGDNIFLGASRQVKVTHNSFRETDFGHSAITSWGGSEVAITGNKACDDDPTASSLKGVGSGRFFVTQCHPDANRNMYIAENTTVNMAPPVNIGDSNQGEQILFEVGTVNMTGRPTAASRSSATFAEVPPAARKHNAVIVSGRGTGQVRRISEVSGRTIKVQPDWAVVPDATSVIGIGGGQTHTVVYHNTLDGKSDFRTYVTASVGMCMYGNVSDIVFADNTVTDVHCGLVAEWSEVPEKETPTPSALYFNLVTGNKLKGSFDGLQVRTNWLHRDMPGTVGHLGNTYRRNSIVDVQTGIDFGTDDNGWLGGDLQQNVYEHNDFSTVRTLLKVGLASPWAKGTIRTRFDRMSLYANRFDRGAAPLAGSAALKIAGDTITFWSSLNRWIDFESSTTDRDTAPGVSKGN